MSYGVTYLGEFNHYASRCQIQSKSDCLWRFVSRTTSSMFQHGKLKFTDMYIQKETTVKCRVNTSIYFPGIIYDARDPVNLELAFNERANSKRANPQGYVGNFDKDLRKNQKTFCSSPGVKSYISELHKRLSIAFHSVDDSWYALCMYCYIPHIKKKLRVGALLEVVRDSLFLIPTFIKKVSGKVKTKEWAKIGKFPRLINDLTVVGSILGGYFCSLIKNVMAEEPFEYKNSKAYFIKTPDKEKMTQIFTYAMNTSTEDIIFVYFSDDSWIIMRCSDGWAAFNVDISKCDASHCDSLFYVLKDSLPDYPASEYVNGNIEQCRLPLRMRNPSDNDEYIELETTCYTLYSGVTLTTIMNNIANILIFISIVDNFDRKIKICDAEKLVVESSRNAGYLVTCDSGKSPDKWQFLKNSFFILDDGRVVPWLNLGVIFRSLGIVDFNYRNTRKFNAHQHMCELVNGLQHAGETSILRMLRRKYPPADGGITGHYLIDNMTGTSFDYDVPDHVICDRYNVSQKDIDEFIFLFENAGPGDVVRTPFTDAVMTLDYGYDCDVELEFDYQIEPKSDREIRLIK